ncbi:hypothetical protein, partial [Sinorhizobium medicae]|uniref:hypothetical protein n=1 Tax=Sinorhizobium medicae TaxID=110321 RepID=UPI001AECDB20
GRLVMVSPVSGIYAKVRQKFHLSPLFKFPEPALTFRRVLRSRPQFHCYKPRLLRHRRDEPASKFQREKSAMVGQGIHVEPASFKGHHVSARKGWHQSGENSQLGSEGR